MEFVDCLNAPSQVEQGTDLDFDFSLEIFNSDLNYFIQALLVEENNPSNHQQLSNTFRLFTLGNEEQFNLSKEITLSPGDYKLFIYGNGSGTQSDDVANAGSCSPTTTTASGTTTHFKSIEVLPPCSENATINISNPQAGSYYNGCLLYTSPSPRDRTRSRMPSSA